MREEGSIEGMKRHKQRINTMSADNKQREREREIEREREKERGGELIRIRYLSMDRKGMVA